MLKKIDSCAIDVPRREAREIGLAQQLGQHRETVFCSASINRKR